MAQTSPTQPDLELGTRAPHEDILDYEAEEPEADEPVEQSEAPAEPEQDEKEDEEESVKDPSLTRKTRQEIKPPENDDDDDDELEEGEVSDEDEEMRKERLKPQPVCRFYNKGQCTWGTSCRFKHPGVMDKGNYNMFEAPKPILPGADDVEMESVAKDEDEKAASMTDAMDAPPVPEVPKIETAWERGLRQAKEMRKLSQMRKQTDVEYEEKKENLSLTQAEIEQENDYYARQASPLHEDEYSDYEDPYMGDGEPPIVRPRRIAPPPPDDFEYYDEPPSRGRLGHRYSPPPPPDPRDLHRLGSRYSRRSPGSYQPHGSGFSSGERIVRRVPPPPPSPGYKSVDRQRRSRSRANDFAKRSVSRRRQSYSSASSRSSSKSSSSRSRSRTPPPRSRGRRRKGSSSESSASSRSGSSRSDTRSRSRSSSPDDIPRRRKRHSRGERNAEVPPPGSSKGLQRKRNDVSGAAPLQKRLSNLSKVAVRKIKKEPEDRPKHAPVRRKSSSVSSRSRSPSTERTVRIKKEKDAQGPSVPTHKSKTTRPAVPPVVPLDDSRSKKPGSPSRTKGSSSNGKSQIKMTLKSSMSTKPANKTVLEKLGMNADDQPEPEIANAIRKRKIQEPDEPDTNRTKKVLESKKKKEKKSAADRREELLKQLKAVENAIAKKRTKMSA